MYVNATTNNRKEQSFLFGKCTCIISFLTDAAVCLDIFIMKRVVFF